MLVRGQISVRHIREEVLVLEQDCVIQTQESKIILSGSDAEAVAEKITAQGFERDSGDQISFTVIPIE
jgi:hypothetical protein